MIYQNVLRGADPELFLVNEKGHFVSAIDKIGGSKQFPKPIDDYGHAVQEDNVAVEFNIPPAKSLEEFKASVTKVLSYLSQEVAKMKLQLAIYPSAIFPDEELEDERAFIFGCDPDYNVYTHDVNPKPRAVNPNLRSCGGHLHISWDQPNMEQREQMIIAHDLFVGVPSLFFDMDDRRRELYGKAGAFRPKPYGVEYRTLSNFWISRPDLVDWVFHQSERAVNFLNEGHKIDYNHYPLIISAINDLNYDAQQLLTQQYPIYNPEKN